VSVSMFQSALPRRERPEGNTSAFSVLTFQSALPRRERHPMTHTEPDALAFQSALPRRERRRQRLGVRDNACFNPRSREGSDKPEEK